LPEARRQGLTKALIEKGLEYGSSQATLSGKKFVASIVVEKDNIAARSLYEKSGFVTFKEEPHEAHDIMRTVLLMKLE
jgi:ribosomal protein S18 acetylase RimI-like enzyme